METMVDPVGKRLGTRFFNQEAEVVALDLIGCVLVRDRGKPLVLQEDHGNGSSLRGSPEANGQGAIANISRRASLR
jgi:hypothetical protein